MISDFRRIIAIERMHPNRGTGSLHKLIAAVGVFILLSTISFPSISRADTLSPPVPPPTRAMDALGVNLISAGPVTQKPTLSSAGLSNTLVNTSIPMDGSGGVGTTWYPVEEYGDSFTGYIADSYSTGFSSATSIMIGGQRLQPGVDIFLDNCTGNICTYWTKDGASYLFDTTKKSDEGLGVLGKIGMLVQINKPDGEIIRISLTSASYTYMTTIGGPIESGGSAQVHFLHIYYPTNIVSSNGWMEKYEYTTQDHQLLDLGTGPTYVFTVKVPTKTYIINTSVDYCDPAATSCTSTNQSRWPTWKIVGCGFCDGSNAPMGWFGSESTQSASGRKIAAYGFAVQSHRVTGAYYNGMHATYAYSWVDGTAGTAPYIITATKSDGTAYTTQSDAAYWQLSYSYVGQFGIAYLKHFYLSQMSSFKDELGRITKYEYNNDNNAWRADNRSLKRVISPEATYSGSVLTGGYTEYGYDSRRNITSVAVYPKGGGTPQVSYYSYETTCTAATYIYCNKLKTFTDPKGNITRYTYSTVHGQILSETKPADASGVQLQTRFSYTQLYPKILNSSGALVNSTPVWRLTKTSSCRTATAANPASCVGTDQETVTEYGYGTNNLLQTKVTVRAGNANVANAASATNVWAATTYTYDDVGNQTVVDGPLPGTVDQTLTMYDIRRRPVYEMGVDPDGGGALPRVIVHHLYDIDGREYRTETGWGFGSLVLSCSTTAATCTNYTVTSYVQRTYDATNGLEVKSITAKP